MTQRVLVKFHHKAQEFNIAQSTIQVWSDEVLRDFNMQKQLVTDANMTPNQMVLSTCHGFEAKINILHTTQEEAMTVIRKDLSELHKENVGL
jgi:hypothetical protein